MKRVFILGVVCLALLASCKKTPTTPEIQPPTINYFTASPAEMDRNEYCSLSWSVYNADTISIDQGIGPVGPSGSVSVGPTVTTTYQLMASNSGGTEYESCTVVVNAVAKMILASDISRTMTSYGCPVFLGYVQNIGTATGYNCMVTITCYSDAAKTIIIDTAHGFPANLGDIPPGVMAYFEAVAFDCDSHDQIPAYTVKIEWLTLNVMAVVDRMLLKKITLAYQKTQERINGKR